jgi:hypothetical protein
MCIYRMADVTDSFKEVFNEQVLKHLLKYQNYYKTLLRRPSKDESYAPFTTLQNYADKAAGNSIVVKYSRSHGRGRRFAKGALSMQSLPREIRGGLAKGLYYDLDFVNCHPVIIRTICKKRSFMTVYLNSYIDNRELVINEILKLNSNLAYEDVKRAILTVIYGGNADYNAIKNKTSWLLAFKDEIDRLHAVVPEWYPEEYVLQKKIKDEEFNLEGATLSASVCVIEDQLLQLMIDFLKEKKYIKDVAVLTFDGIMVPVNAFSNDENKMKKAMRQIEKIFSESGYEIKLKVKDFETWPSEIPDEYQVAEEASFEEIYRSTDYYWYDFINEMSQVHECYTSMCNLFKKKINMVALRAFELEGLIIRKISRENMLHFDRTCPVDAFQYWDQRPDGTPYIANITFKQLVLSHGLISNIQRYNKITFAPYGPAEKPPSLSRDFNSWAGFQAKLIPEDEIKMELVQPILDHIKAVWSNHDEGIYVYIMSWMHGIFSRPSSKTKVALVLQSTEKQVGKGSLLNEFIIPYVFGRSNAMSISGLDTPTAKFNEIMMNKLLVNADELSTIEGGYHQAFDVMKKLITDSTIKIEIKNGRSFIYPDFCNYILFTNHDFTIKTEQGDARYMMTSCSPCFKGNFEYFNKLFSFFNQTTADHFFSYVHNMKNPVEIRDIPMTQLKKDMILMGLPSSQRFLLDIKDSYLEKEEEWVPASQLYKMYKYWCEESKEKILSNTAFGRTIAGMIEKKKKSCVVYDLASIKFEF